MRVPLKEAADSFDLFPVQLKERLQPLDVIHSSTPSPDLPFQAIHDFAGIPKRLSCALDSLSEGGLGRSFATTLLTELDNRRYEPRGACPGPATLAPSTTASTEENLRERRARCAP